MSRRLGFIGLALGVIFIVTAMGISTAPHDTLAGAGPSVTLSTGFVIWSSCGVIGLMVGLIASRWARPSPARGRTPTWESLVTHPSAPRPDLTAESLNAALEAAEGLT